LSGFCGLSVIRSDEECGWGGVMDDRDVVH
jgi:hypothetical protein